MSKGGGVDSKGRQAQIWTSERLERSGVERPLRRIFHENQSDVVFSMIFKPLSLGAFALVVPLLKY